MERKHLEQLDSFFHENVSIIRIQSTDDDCRTPVHQLGYSAQNEDLTWMFLKNLPHVISRPIFWPLDMRLGSLLAKNTYWYNTSTL